MYQNDASLPLNPCQAKFVLRNTKILLVQVTEMQLSCTVYPKKYAHGFVVLCFVVVMQSFIMNSHEVFIHIHQGCFAGTGAIVRLPQCQWSKPDGYGKISQCITTTKHSKAKTVCIFLGIYCNLVLPSVDKAATPPSPDPSAFSVIPEHCDGALVEIFPHWRQGSPYLFILHNEYHYCWCSGNKRSQDICSHGINLVFIEYYCFSTRRVKKKQLVA